MFINILKYVFLGVIQGFIEPIPISSSGHVFILKNIINLSVLSDLNFEIIVNAGSLLAIIIIYNKEIGKVIKSFFLFFKDKKFTIDFKYCCLIIIGVIPVGIVGLLFKSDIERVLSNINIVGISFIITALLLFLVRNKNGIREKKDINFLDALFIGLSQVISVIPGISRSGITLVAGSFRGLSRINAFDYSFMMYIPISIASTFIGIKDICSISNLHELIIPYGIGFIVSFIVTFFTMEWFKRIVKKTNFIVFSIYCLVLGLLVLIFM
ncbi:MAG: undecaprenyl-diphosphate phosphatase [Bacilli bacterium]